MAKKIFEPDNPKPFKVSRSKIENFIRCKACFWMDRVKGINFPGMPGFTLNSATDSLMKKDFDKYRELQKPHLYLLLGLHLLSFCELQVVDLHEKRAFASGKAALVNVVMRQDIDTGMKGSTYA